MAGFVTGAMVPGGYYEFHNDTPDVVKKIREMSGGRRVVSLQLDCDELEAALWGFENYPKAKAVTEEIPIQRQLQYQRIVCPNCFSWGDVIYETSGEQEPTHGCHKCGQEWVYEA